MAQAEKFPPGKVACLAQLPQFAFLLPETQSARSASRRAQFQLWIFS